MTPLRYIRTEVFRTTQAKMAEIVGVGQSTISKWEQGQLEPGRDELARIRAEAVARRLKWKDAWFFQAPAPSAPESASAQ